MVIILKIKDIPKEMRPRERLINSNVNALTDSEVLAVILNTGTKELDALELANYLIDTYGINKLCNLEYNELIKIKGISVRKATLLIALFELVKRTSRLTNNIILNNPNNIFNYIKSDYMYYDTEVLTILFVNTKCHLLYKLCNSSNNIANVEVNIKHIISLALKYNAYGIILIHNHPSGDVSPSREDIVITNRLRTTLELLDIELLDHLIISKNKYYSFLGNGNLIK